MATILINVCQSCIDLQRNPNHSQQCAIYSALKTEYPDKDIHVGKEIIKIDDWLFACMPEVIGWQVGNVYNSQRAKPITLVFDTNEWSVSISE